jgi:hypothetical protein
MPVIRAVRRKMKMMNAAKPASHRPRLFQVPDGVAHLLALVEEHVETHAGELRHLLELGNLGPDRAADCARCCQVDSRVTWTPIAGLPSTRNIHSRMAA